MADIEKYTDFLFYNSEDGTTKVQVIADRDTETIWTTQKGMSDIFGVDQSVISRHISNIYEDGELSINSTMQKMHNANSAKPVNYYNLDLIISVSRNSR